LAWTAALPIEAEIERKKHCIVFLLLLRAQLVQAKELDVHVASRMEQGRSIPWMELAMQLLRQCVLDRIATLADFPNVTETLKLGAHRHGQVSQLAEFMKELHASQVGEPGDKAKRIDPPGVREQVTHLLESWIKVWNEAGGDEQKCVKYLSLLRHHNVLKTDESTEVFLRIATEVCVGFCIKTGMKGEGDTPKLDYKVIDAFANMLVILVKYASNDPQSLTSRVQLLNRILGILSRVLVANVESSRPDIARPGVPAFDQRPYFRIFLNLLRDLTVPDPVVDASNLQVLGAFANAFHALQPSSVPAFAFSWLELVSHRSFMPTLLLAKVASALPCLLPHALSPSL
jgi:CCR4-NOT transcription complex subunit 1